MTIRVGGDGPTIPIPDVDLKPSSPAAQPKAPPATGAPVDSFEIPAQNPFDAWGGKPGVLHEKQTLDGPQNEIARARGGVSSAPAEVTTALDEAAKTEIKTGKKVVQGRREYDETKTSPELKSHFDAVKKGIASGDYKSALDALKKGNALIENRTENGLGPAAKTMERQLELLAAMQDAKIKADYPPTEKQLVDYFGTLKKDPAGARRALEMVLLKHKDEKGFTVTSNDGAFKAPTPLAAVREGFAYATGERKDGNGTVVNQGTQTGKEAFYLGSSSGEAMANLAHKENQVR